MRICKKISVLSLTVVAVIAVLSGCSKDTISLVTENFIENLTVYDKTMTLYNQGLDICDQFIDSTISFDEFSDELNELKKQIAGYSGVIADDALNEAAMADSRLDGEVGICTIVDISIQEEQDNLVHMIDYLKTAVYNYEKTYLHNLIDIYRERQVIDCELNWYEVNNYFAGLDEEPKALKNCVARLENFAEISVNWSKDKEIINEQQEIRWAMLDTLYSKQCVMLGDKTIELNEKKDEYENTKEYYIECIMEKYSVTRDVAEKLLEVYENVTEPEE